MQAEHRWSSGISQNVPSTCILSGSLWTLAGFRRTIKILVPGRCASHRGIFKISDHRETTSVVEPTVMVKCCHLLMWYYLRQASEHKCDFDFEFLIHLVGFHPVFYNHGGWSRTWALGKQVRICTYPELAAASRAPLTPILTEERKIEVSGDWRLKGIRKHRRFAGRKVRTCCFTCLDYWGRYIPTPTPPPGYCLVALALLELLIRS